MPPKTKSGSARFLIGQPSSVLSHEFLQAVEEEKNVEDILPFSGCLQLPTKEQVLKLYFFYKDKAGIKNSYVSKHDISAKV